MKAKPYKGLTSGQTALFWRIFSQSCAAQGIPANERETYRKKLMLDLCNKESMSELNRTGDLDKLLLQLALDSGDYELAARYTIGEELRLAKLVEVVARQLMQCQGRELPAAAAYVAGLCEQAGYPTRQVGPTYWLDLSAGQIHALFMALDTHRRRLLERGGWHRNLKFKFGAAYALRADGSIDLTALIPPPENYIQVNIIA